MTYELCDIIMISSICSLCSFIGGIATVERFGTVCPDIAKQRIEEADPLFQAVGL